MIDNNSIKLRGKWIPLWFDLEDETFGEKPSDWKCSLCGNIISYKEWQHANICPHCNSLMM